MTAHDPRPTSTEQVDRRALAWPWPGYAAAAMAFSFAAVTFYWSAGGTAGVSTLGGHFEEWAVALDPMIVALLWFTGVLKVAGGMLALVQPWGRRAPRRWLLLAAGSGGSPADGVRGPPGHLRSAGRVRRRHP